MPNTLLTPAWLVRDAFTRTATVGDTISIRRPMRELLPMPMPQRAPSPSVDSPVDPRVIVAVGAAAVVANPQPISRRALFGLAWKGRRR